MRCEEAQKHMAAFAVDKTMPGLSILLTEHLDTCPSCRLWHEEVLGMLQLWMEEDQKIPELNLVSAVMERIESRPPVKKLGFSKFTVLYHYGIAASLAFGLFYFGVFEHVGVNISHTINHMSEKLVLLDRYDSAP
ncbi:zf-HC2 domain-containing protein [Paenibacillus sp. N3.4]|uniref:zf-HC2 domain-containing protein n=1 Tax=Paenibacillus sp. N3.4 TaxID=2603222 RepID=UPI0011C95DC5|nr:zf-HC2 domain-containing protein [Paenibacillus sp. N3.4]TXK83454.1 zf-HC2 domain-containing protein [Paenibacillus sp. N3.4]